MVLAGIYYIIKGIFKKLPPEENIEGEVVSREAALHCGHGLMRWLPE
jgi:hypothetical protein